MRRRGVEVRKVAPVGVRVGVSMGRRGVEMRKVAPVGVSVGVCVGVSMSWPRGGAWRSGRSRLAPVGVRAGVSMRRRGVEGWKVAPVSVGESIRVSIVVRVSVRVSVSIALNLA